MQFLQRAKDISGRIAETLTADDTVQLGINANVIETCQDKLQTDACLGSGKPRARAGMETRPKEKIKGVL